MVGGNTAGGADSSRRHTAIRPMVIRALVWGLLAIGYWWVMSRLVDAPAPAIETHAAPAHGMAMVVRGGFAGPDLVTGHSDARTLVDILVRHGGGAFQAPSIVTHLLSAARRHDLDPRLLAGVVAVENPTLWTQARNPRSGATGVMQVMPLHVQRADPCGVDLTDPATNICYGSRILKRALNATRNDTRRALLRYNGCVRTPGCARYADHVLGRAGLLDRPSLFEVVAGR